MPKGHLRSRRLLERGGSDREAAEFLPGDGFFGAANRTVLPLSFRQGGERGCAGQSRSQSADGGEDGAHLRAGDAGFGQMDGHGTEVKNVAREAKLGAVPTNAFAFGGMNAVLALRAA